MLSVWWSHKTLLTTEEFQKSIDEIINLLGINQIDISKALADFVLDLGLIECNMEEIRFKYKNLGKKVK